MDGATRAILLGAFVTALIGVLGWSIRRNVSNIDGSIKGLDGTVKDAVKQVATNQQNMNTRVTDLERFKIEVEARHEYEDRKG